MAFPSFAAPSAAGPLTFGTVTPSDTVVIGGLRSIRVGGAGNLSLKGPSDAAAVTFPVTAGEYVPFGQGYVMATGTTATGLVGFG